MIIVIVTYHSKTNKKSIGFLPFCLTCVESEFTGSTSIGRGKPPATFGTFGTCISIQSGTVPKWWKHKDQFLGTSGSSFSRWNPKRDKWMNLLRCEWKRIINEQRILWLPTRDEKAIDRNTSREETLHNVSIVSLRNSKFGLLLHSRPKYCEWS